MFSTLYLFQNSVNQHVFSGNLMIDGEATRKAFEGLIDKPKLTDELLARPPFKFLLDVISNTINNTGYLKVVIPASFIKLSKIDDILTSALFLSLQ